MEARQGAREAVLGAALLTNPRCHVTPPSKIIPRTYSERERENEQSTFILTNNDKQNEKKHNDNIIERKRVEGLVQW